MDFDFLNSKTAASLDEIRVRVAHATARHPLCRSVRFDIVSVPRTRRGSNWTVTLQSVEPRGVWEASEIVADIGRLRSGGSCLISLNFRAMSPSPRDCRRIGTVKP